MTPPTADVPCDHLPATDENATADIACAHAAFDVGNYDVAESRASQTAKKFPYSKRAAEAQELLADILYARGKFEEAAREYQTWMNYHPTNERVAAVKKKHDDALARATGTTGSDPHTGR